MSAPALALLLAAPAPASSPPPSIQDNSFLLEEAYNQEAKVVQHISVFQTDLEGGGWSFAFTQEWPIGGQRHQLSYTLPLGDAGDGAGLGIVALNYRYQLVGSGETRVACAPRLTVMLPTGDRHKGLGTGATGLQWDVPVSIVTAPSWVLHTNAGGTFVRSARGPDGDRADLTSWNLGASVIFLAKPTANALLEVAWTRSGEVAGRHRQRHTDALVVSPGLRWAYNFASGLQIVPGFAFPVGVGPSRGQRSVLFYLSFEHPFGHRPR